MAPTFVGVWIWSMLHAVRELGTPLILYEGANNQVLAVLIWNLWNEGDAGTVAALGAILIVGLLLVTLGLRLIGFGRSVAMRSAS